MAHVLIRDEASFNLTMNSAARGRHSRFAESATRSILVALHDGACPDRSAAEPLRDKGESHVGLKMMSKLVRCWVLTLSSAPTIFISQANSQSFCAVIATHSNAGT